MDYAKLLARGVGAWVQYEWACDHSGLFSEKNLAQPIGHILAGQSKNRARAEYTHTILASHMKGRGKRPAVDFVVFGEYPKVEIAVESKWFGKTDVTIEDIVWDLVRLELLANDGAECFFVLGGTRRSLDKLFADKDFAKGTSNRRPCPFLRHDNNILHPISIGPIDRRKLGILQPMYTKYPDLKFPTNIVTRRTAPFPEMTTIDGYQVYVWKISSAQNRKTFSARRASRIFSVEDATRP
ncbi:MAG: hypothetical protein NTV56_00965 [Alphaproteobacteria bacterium]|nr:hypothetical protein [Alphaproteobacteria bacterium]